MTKSVWKLTFDPNGTPLVLLDFGERIAEDISWASRRGFEVVDLLDETVLYSPMLRVQGGELKCSGLKVRLSKRQ